jgi:N-acetylglutamate synthase-like GNAT family acetyltransferase
VPRGLTIRDASADDAQSLARLVGQLGYPAESAALAERVNRLTSSPADRLVVAELDGHVVGLVSIHVSLVLEYDEPAAKLGALAVDERYRRRGIGEALVAAMEDEARVRGCRLIYLTSAQPRSDAHAFYRRIGFDETGLRFAKWLDGVEP